MYSIQEVCRRTGLTTHTLRYYEKEGLLTHISRSAGGFRQYTDEDLECLGLICCLKNTGMPLQKISRFVQLSQGGDTTLEERVKLLKEHREKLIARMEEMQQYLEKITWKVNFFSGKLEEHRKEKQAETKTEKPF